MRWAMTRTRKDNDIPEAEDHYKRALALDPKLAMAWARLGVIYLNSGQTGKAMEYFTKAHELSGNVSERERLYIEGHYYAEVVGDLDKAIETLEVAIQEYPLQVDNYVNLGATVSGRRAAGEGAGNSAEGAGAAAGSKRSR